MTDKERMAELIEVFTDADKRSCMTEDELAYCPDVMTILYVMAE